jgi:phosphoribosylanthranilate isomerase
MTIRIKICGITREQDALAAAKLGVDALGFIFVKKSPRYISPGDASAIIAHLPPFISRVGVFADEAPENVIEAAREASVDTIQLHGEETPDYCRGIPFPVIKALGLRPDFDLKRLKEFTVSGILLDTWQKGLKGGTGIAGDWNIAKHIAERCSRTILAGGLGPSNLEAALTTVRPYGVDINSGVEISPGVKNPHKMREAVRIIRAWHPTL